MGSGPYGGITLGQLGQGFGEAGNAISTNLQRGAQEQTRIGERREALTREDAAIARGEANRREDITISQTNRADDINRQAQYRNEDRDRAASWRDEDIRLAQNIRDAEAAVRKAERAEDRAERQAELEAARKERDAVNARREKERTQDTTFNALLSRQANLQQQWDKHKAIDVDSLTQAQKDQWLKDGEALQGAMSALGKSYQAFAADPDPYVQNVAPVLNGLFSFTTNINYTGQEYARNQARYATGSGERQALQARIDQLQKDGNPMWQDLVPQLRELDEELSGIAGTIGVKSFNRSGLYDKYTQGDLDNFKRQAGYMEVFEANRAALQSTLSKPEFDALAARAEQRKLTGDDITLIAKNGERKTLVDQFKTAVMQGKEGAAYSMAQVLKNTPEADLRAQLGDEYFEALTQFNTEGHARNARGRAELSSNLVNQGYTNSLVQQQQTQRVAASVAALAEAGPNGKGLDPSLLEHHLGVLAKEDPTNPYLTPEGRERLKKTNAANIAFNTKNNQLDTNYKAGLVEKITQDIKSGERQETSEFAKAHREGYLDLFDDATLKDLKKNYIDAGGTETGWGNLITQSRATRQAMFKTGMNEAQQSVYNTTIARQNAWYATNILPFKAKADKAMSSQQVRDVADAFALAPLKNRATATELVHGMIQSGASLDDPTIVKFAKQYGIDLGELQDTRNFTREQRAAWRNDNAQGDLEFMLKNPEVFANGSINPEQMARISKELGVSESTIRQYARMQAQYATTQRTLSVQGAKLDLIRVQAEIKQTGTSITLARANYQLAVSGLKLDKERVGMSREDLERQWNNQGLSFLTNYRMATGQLAQVQQQVVQEAAVRVKNSNANGYVINGNIIVDPTTGQPRLADPNNKNTGVLAAFNALNDQYQANVGMSRLQNEYMGFTAAMSDVMRKNPKGDIAPAVFRQLSDPDINHIIPDAPVGGDAQGVSGAAVTRPGVGVQKAFQTMGGGKFTVTSVPGEGHPSAYDLVFTDATGKNKNVSVTNPLNVPLRVVKKFVAGGDDGGGYGHGLMAEVMAGPNKGSYVIIGHLAGASKFGVGGTIKPGEALGIQGNTGTTSNNGKDKDGVHVHFEVRDSSKKRVERGYVDRLLADNALTPTTSTASKAAPDATGPFATTYTGINKQIAPVLRDALKFGTSAQVSPGQSFYMRNPSGNGYLTFNPAQAEKVWGSVYSEMVRETPELKRADPSTVATIMTGLMASEGFLGQSMDPIRFSEWVSKRRGKQ